MAVMDPEDCECPCHQGAAIFCSCFGPCCNEPTKDTRPSPPLVLMERDAFRNNVFRRDGWRCVICVRESVKHVRANYRTTSLEGVSDASIKRNLFEMATARSGGDIGDGALRYMGISVPVPRAAVDAHHILERRLWGDGGYYMDNGASLCEEHHLEAERTTLSCEEIREAAGITRVILPKHLYRDQTYDKWGNPTLPNGTRLKGDLFFDESVQKVLSEGGMLSLFTSHVKFPRTYHLPWSPGLTKDDRMMETKDPFAGKRVVVTAKMDGENTTMYSDYVHARSLAFEPHPSRNWVKSLWGRVAHDIPEGWRVCGENLYAEHSIAYKHLDDWFLVFSVWNERNVCLSWDETKEWAALLGFKTVPVIYEGLGDRKLIENLHKSERNGDPCEGFVARIVESFPYSEYRTAVGKYVRASHVGTHGHWMRQQVKINGRKEA